MGGAIAPGTSPDATRAEGASIAAGAAVWSSIGYAVAPSGDDKAVYWSDLTLAPVVLPELVQAAGLQSRAESLTRLADGRVVITGFSENAAGMAQPVAWVEDAVSAGTFTLETFALPEWAVAGTVTGFAGTVLNDLDSGFARSAGTGGPHAAISTPIPQAEIPAVTEWGLMVMTLLVLTAGTMVVGRKRRAAM